MNKEIRYNGQTVVPSDYDSPDGDLDISLNLINENGSIQPVPNPPKLFKVPKEAGENPICFIHEGEFGKHYIVYNRQTSTLGYLQDGAFKSIGVIPDAIDINSVGNVLSLITKECVIYVLWQNTKYHLLGNRPPEINIEFKLVKYSDKEDMEMYFPGLSTSSILSELANGDTIFINEQDQKIINDGVMAAFLPVHKEVKEATDPFFVRYAYRLYDGSYAWHSAPVLMLPNNFYQPMISILSVHKNTNDIPYLKTRLTNCQCALYYRVLPFDLNEFGLWSEIIKGIDIFRSDPLHTFNQEGKIKVRRSRGAKLFDISIQKKDSNEVLTSVYLTNIFDKPVFEGWPQWTDDICLSFETSTPMLTQISELREFHYIGTLFSRSDFKGTTRDWEMSFRSLGPDMRVLRNDKILDDDYCSNRTIIPQTQLTYNSRMNYANLRIFPPKPFSLRSAIQSYSNNISEYSLCQITVWLKKKGKIISRTLKMPDKSFEDVYGLGNLASKYHFPVIPDIFDLGIRGGSPLYIFYPDADAFAMKIQWSNGKHMLFPLRAHEHLNGAFSVYNSDQLLIPDELYELASESEDSYTSARSIYVWYVNNPFVFDPLLNVSLGLGDNKILAISSAARALSQGQFGQFPLYAFSSDGIWALQVSDTGTYSARQPITRDVCSNPEGITQIDSAVLFPTDRGIMIISGSQTECLSDIINTQSPFHLDSLPAASTIKDICNIPADTALGAMPLTKFIASGSMIYDYFHQRIIVFNPDCLYAYILSLKSRLWSQILLHSPIKARLNSYPEALAINENGEIIDFSAPIQSYSDSTISEAIPPGLLVSRPFKLDQPDIHKTIDTIIQRGRFRSGHVQTILYGSRDLFNWHLVSSSVTHRIQNRHGTPYKYFRVALVCRLDTDESISGCSVQYTPRLLNRLR